MTSESLGFFCTVSYSLCFVCTAHCLQAICLHTLHNVYYLVLTAMIQIGGHFSNGKLSSFPFREPAVLACFMQFDENDYDEWMIYIYMAAEIVTPLVAGGG